MQSNIPRNTEPASPPAGSIGSALAVHQGPEIATHLRPAVLDPTLLDPVAERAALALREEGESENTVRSYRGALRYWAAWYWLRYARRLELPVQEAAVMQFIVDHVQRQDDATGGLVCELPPAIDEALVSGGFKAAKGALALTTVSHRLSVLSKVHRMGELVNPCDQPKVRDLMDRARKAYAKRLVSTNKKAALAREQMDAILKTCDDTMIGLRDKALLLFAWASGGRRRSEVTGATFERLTRLGPGQYVFNMGRSKTQQAGAGAEEGGKPVMGVAGQALEDWIKRSGLKEGAIFRRIRGHEVVAERLAPSAVRDIVIERAQQAGLDPKKYSAHSLRSGFVTEAARQKVPMGDTMAMTGHKSIATVIGYFRTEESVKSPAARLMDGGKPDR